MHYAGRGYENTLWKRSSSIHLFVKEVTAQCANEQQFEMSDFQTTKSRNSLRRGGSQQLSLCFDEIPLDVDRLSFDVRLKFFLMADGKPP